MCSPTTGSVALITGVDFSLSTGPSRLRAGRRSRGVCGVGAPESGEHAQGREGDDSHQEETDGVAARRGLRDAHHDRYALTEPSRTGTATAIDSCTSESEASASCVPWSRAGWAVIWPPWFAAARVRDSGKWTAQWICG